MSRMGVATVIDKLLTDENLRIQFALDRIETVAELCLEGAELTRDEVDLFCRTDARCGSSRTTREANGGTEDRRTSDGVPSATNASERMQCRFTLSHVRRAK